MRASLKLFLASLLLVSSFSSKAEVSNEVRQLVAEVYHLSDEPAPHDDLIKEELSRLADSGSAYGSLLISALDSTRARQKYTQADLDHHIAMTKKRIKANLTDNFWESIFDHFGACDYQSSSECLVQHEDYLAAHFENKFKVCAPSTTCGFYKCMEGIYQCSKTQEFYFSKLAFPTCSSYEKNIYDHRFSLEGVTWIYEVMTCLQKGLVDECDLKGNCSRDVSDRKKTCGYITDYTLNFHPSCYFNSGVGVCNLSLRDQLNIFRTVGPYLTKPEKKQARKVVLECLKRKILGRS